MKYFFQCVIFRNCKMWAETQATLIHLLSIPGFLKNCFERLHCSGPTFVLGNCVGPLVIAVSPMRVQSFHLCMQTLFNVNNDCMKRYVYYIPFIDYSW